MNPPSPPCGYRTPSSSEPGFMKARHQCLTFTPHSHIDRAMCRDMFSIAGLQNAASYRPKRHVFDCRSAKCSVISRDMSSIAGHHSIRQQRAVNRRKDDATADISPKTTHQHQARHRLAAPVPHYHCTLWLSAHTARRDCTCAGSDSSSNPCQVHMIEKREARSEKHPCPTATTACRHTPVSRSALPALPLAFGRFLTRSCLCHLLSTARNLMRLSMSLLSTGFALQARTARWHAPTIAASCSKTC